jgi:ABC-2 type transport system permease protein
MQHPEQDMSPAGSAEIIPIDRPNQGVAFFRKAFAIAGMELRKLRRDPTELATRAIQPALWLLVFGEVMARARMVDTGGTPYLAFLVPGVLAQSVLFIAIFNGISVIWERDLGIVHRFLVSPTPRGALVLGKALGGSARALVQAVVVLTLAVLIGVHLNWSPLNLTGAVALILLGAMLFSTFSLAVACIVKTRERFMGVGQVLTMPLFFASNAIYPTSLMPSWLQAISHVNPLTYQIDGLRTFLLPAAAGAELARIGLWTDFAVLAVTFVALATLSAKLYPKIVQ